MTKTRCPWAGSSEIYTKYHDKEWGVPVFNDRLLFEFLILEGAQAGLSWITVLKKRPHYRKLFDQFDPKKVAQYKAAKINQFLKDPGIIRNRLKIESSISNAKAFLKVQKEEGSFHDYIWRFVSGKPKINRFKLMKDVPAKTDISDVMSKDLIKRGFRFVGSTICYAYMQAVGMVNDHLASCYRYQEIIKRVPVTN